MTFGSLMPSVGPDIELFIDYDKVIHVIFYLVMTYLGLHIFKSKTLLTFLFCIAFSALYGAFMEIMQAYLDMGRHFDYYDIIANIIGALIGAVLHFKFNK